MRPRVSAMWAGPIETSRSESGMVSQSVPETLGSFTHGTCRQLSPGFTFRPCAGAGEGPAGVMSDRIQSRARAKRGLPPWRREAAVRGRGGRSGLELRPRDGALVPMPRQPITSKSQPKPGSSDGWMYTPSGPRVMRRCSANISYTLFGPPGAGIVVSAQVSCGNVARK